jgi:ATP-binding cassette subfamily C protein LapB
MQLSLRNSSASNYISISNFKNKIKFTNVEFKYPRSEQKIINIEKLELSNDAITVVMGPVGSGKTTLLKLIAGLYLPTEGQLLIDGIEIKQLSPADWRSQVAWVSQDAVLFRGTLRENLLISSPLVSDERFIHILKLSGIDNLIRNHPLGLDMQLGESGQQLSGGQRQMVALARALITDKPVILLDEPSSSLDMNNEKLLLQNLKSEFSNKLVLIATHRPGPLEIADRLIILDNGKIAANGLKESVLQDIKNGFVKRTAPSNKIAEEVAV